VIFRILVVTGGSCHWTIVECEPLQNLYEHHLYIVDLYSVQSDKSLSVDCGQLSCLISFPLANPM